MARRGADGGGVPSAVEDFLFHAIAAECGRLGMAVHFHTAKQRAATSISKEPIRCGSKGCSTIRLRKTNFVMVHGGWPFTREVERLPVCSNVDGLFAAAVPAGCAKSELARTIRAWLEVTPEKVMFGTDSYPTAPEAGLGWTDATLIASEKGREALGQRQYLPMPVVWAKARHRGRGRWFRGDGAPRECTQAVWAEVALSYCDFAVRLPALSRRKRHPEGMSVVEP